MHRTALALVILIAGSYTATAKGTSHAAPVAAKAVTTFAFGTAPRSTTRGHPIAHVSRSYDSVVAGAFSHTLASQRANAERTTGIK